MAQKSEREISLSKKYISCSRCGKVIPEINMRYTCLECSREEVTITGPWALFSDYSESMGKGQWMATDKVTPVWVYEGLPVAPGDKIIREIKDEDSPMATVYKILNVENPSLRIGNLIGTVIQRFAHIYEIQLYNEGINPSDQNIDKEQEKWKIVRCVPLDMTNEFEINSLVLIRLYQGTFFEGCILKQYIPYVPDDDDYE